jgi:hypothetical protein
MSSRRPKKSRRTKAPIALNLPQDLDTPILGAARIAAAAGMFTAAGAPDAHKLYYKMERGLLEGIVFKNGRELVSNRRQLQRLGQMSISPENAA